MNGKGKRMSFDPKVFEFKKQLGSGKVGEDLLLEYYHMPVILSEDLKYDLRCVHTGHKIEVKTDYYDISRTPFFFFERHSKTAGGGPGGPWRAKQDRIPLFVYLFIKNHRYFVLKDITKMLKVVDKWIEKEDVQPILIKNTGWVTAGYKVPRDLVQAFWTEYEFTPQSGKRARLVGEGISQEI
jgi:hypothetical protein